MFTDDVAQLLPELKPKLLARGVRRHEVDDVLQSTFVRAVDKQHLYDPSQPLQAWLATLATNIFRNDMAKRKVRKAVTIHAESGTVEIVDDLADVESEVDTDDHAASLRSRLDPELDRIVDAAYRFGHAEAAEMLGVNVSTIKNRVHKALKTMRREPGTGHEPAVEVVEAAAAAVQQQPTIAATGHEQPAKVQPDPLGRFVARVRQHSTSTTVVGPFMTTRRAEAQEQQKKVNSAVFYHKSRGWLARVNGAEIPVADRATGLKLVAA